MRYTIEKENEVKLLCEQGRSIEYINSVTGIPKKVIWQWCPELRPHEDIIRQSVKQRYHFLFPDLEAKITSAFSPYICSEIKEDDWELLNKLVYDVLYEEALAVFKNVITDPPTFSETKKLSNEKFLDYLKKFWDYETSEYIKQRNEKTETISKPYADMCKNTLHYWSSLKNKLMRDVTKGDIEIVHEKLTEKKLSQSRIYFILEIALIPLKYAYNNGQTFSRVFEYKLPKRTKEKNNLLSPLVISKIFNSDWKCTESFLGNFIAYSLGLTLKEVRALRLCDIYTENVIVTNNIYTQKKGLEENPNKKVFKISKNLYNCLLKYTSASPYKDYKQTDYVFYSQDRNKPATANDWIKDLKDVASKYIDDADLLTFSIWTKELTISQS